MGRRMCARYHADEDGDICDDAHGDDWGRGDISLAEVFNKANDLVEQPCKARGCASRMDSSNVLEGRGCSESDTKRGPLVRFVFMSVGCRRPIDEKEV